MNPTTLLKPGKEKTEKQGQKWYENYDNNPSEKLFGLDFSSSSGADDNQIPDTSEGRAMGLLIDYMLHETKMNQGCSARKPKN